MKPDPARLASALERAERLTAEALAIIAEVRDQLAPQAEPAREEDFLEPRVLAERLGIGAPWVRTLCQRAYDRHEPGVKKIGERCWLVTASAIERERRR